MYPASLLRIEDTPPPTFKIFQFCPHTRFGGAAVAGKAGVDIQNTFTPTGPTIGPARRSGRLYILHFLPFAAPLHYRFRKSESVARYPLNSFSFFIGFCIICILTRRLLFARVFLEISKLSKSARQGKRATCFLLLRIAVFTS